MILHELGHFSAAKAVGMRVEKFSLFFPPTLWSKKVGETEYAIGSIPAGGYVKISGMNPDEDLPEEVRDRAYHAQPVWKRIVVIARGAGREPGAGVRAAVRLLRGDRAADRRREVVDQVEKNYPGRGRAAARATGWWRWTASEASPARLSDRDQLARLRRAAERSGRRAAGRPTPAKLTVVRNGQRLTFTIRAEVRLPGDGVDEGRMRVGFAYKPGPRDPLPLGEALQRDARTASGSSRSRRCSCPRG